MGGGEEYRLRQSENLSCHTIPINALANSRRKL